MTHKFDTSNYVLLRSAARLVPVHEHGNELNKRKISHEHPIIFSAPMVRAILEGKKTQTRRIINPFGDEFVQELLDGKNNVFTLSNVNKRLKCPYGKLNDRLWVRETWQTLEELNGIRPRDIPNDSDIQYPATYDGGCSKKRPSLYMPRWASRITLEITGIRCERLQDVSDNDAVAEGISYSEAFGGWHTESGRFFNMSSPKESYAMLWDSINEKNDWHSNPFVWVIDFRVLHKGERPCPKPTTTK